MLPEVKKLISTQTILIPTKKEAAIDSRETKLKIFEIRMTKHSHVPLYFHHPQDTSPKSTERIAKAIVLNKTRHHLPEINKQVFLPLRSFVIYILNAPFANRNLPTAVSVNYRIGQRRLQRMRFISKVAYRRLKTCLSKIKKYSTRRIPTII